MDAHILLRRRVRTLLAVMLGGMLAVCAACTAKEPPDDLTTMSVFHSYRGFMVWSCDQDTPAVFVRGGLKDSLAVRETEAHEYSHAAFAMSFPSCEAYHRWRNADPENVLTFEALAACAALRQRVRNGRTDHPEALARAARALVRGYGIEGLTEERARARLLAVCR